MFIQNNINSMNALNNLNTNETQLTSSIQKLSSGFRLNRAGDDAAGLSIANSLRNNGVGLLAAQQNVSQANSVLQIADGATQGISTILDRMKQLATESASANVTDSDRQKIQAEFSQLTAEIDRTVGSTVYQGQKLLAGTFGMTQDTAAANSVTVASAGPPAVAGVSNVSVSGAAASTTYVLTYASNALTLTGNGMSQTVATGTAGSAQQYNFDKMGVSFAFNGDASTAFATNKNIATTANAAASFRVGSGAVSDTDNLVSLTLGDISTSGLGLSSANLGTFAGATTALGSISSAVATLNTTIGTIGAAESRLGYATSSVASLYQNVSAAESVIRDTNMAQEYTNFSKLSILQQAGTAMLAQANSSQSSVLKLFQ